MTFSYGAVCRPKYGQSVSGDLYLVHEHPDGWLLVTVIDGLGGGEEAARAARAAEAVIQANPAWPLQELTQKSHTALHNTRGAVIGMLRLDAREKRANYVGVGNIGIHAYSRQPIKPISKNGILGFRLPPLLELRYSYDPGDTFVLFSDGVSSRFAQEHLVNVQQSPQQISEFILETYGKSIDDATVVTVKT